MIECWNMVIKKTDFSFEAIPNLLFDFAIDWLKNTEGDQNLPGHVVQFTTFKEHN